MAFFNFTYSSLWIWQHAAILLPPFWSETSQMREMVGEFIHKSPDEMRDTFITHQFMYKNLLPLDVLFVFCEDLEYRT